MNLIRIKPLISLARADIKNVRRDPMLLLVLCGTVLLALFFRYVRPIVTEWLLQTYAFDLSHYYDLILVVILQIVPLMVGMVVGFMMLDERDENLIQYFFVTPLKQSGYLFVRLTIPFLLTMGLCLFVVYFTSLVQLSMFKLIPLLWLLALSTPMFTLFLVAFASNKVEGLALSKASGILSVFPIAPFFLAPEWQVVVSVVPTYWAGKIMALNENGITLLYTTCFGLLIYTIFLSLLYQRFKRRFD